MTSKPAERLIIELIGLLILAGSLANCSKPEDRPAIHQAPVVLPKPLWRLESEVDSMTDKASYSEVKDLPDGSFIAIGCNDDQWSFLINDQRIDTEGFVDVLLRLDQEKNPTSWRMFSTHRLLGVFLKRKPTRGDLDKDMVNFTGLYILSHIASAKELRVRTQSLSNDRLEWAFDLAGANGAVRKLKAVCKTPLET